MMAHVPSPDIHTITDPTDERLADYVSLTDVALRSRHEPSKGLYIAESSTVLRRALGAGHRPRSVLLSPRWLPDLVTMLASLPDDGTSVPVYVAESDVLEAITGFHVHRGALASMHRPALASVHDLLSAARGGPAHDASRSSRTSSTTRTSARSSGAPRGSASTRCS